MFTRALRPLEKPNEQRIWNNTNWIHLIRKKCQKFLTGIEKPPQFELLKYFPLRTLICSQRIRQLVGMAADDTLIVIQTGVNS